MELKKRKYKQREVVAMFNAYRAEYESIINTYRAQISNLNKENADLLSQLDAIKQKEHLILSTLERAEQTAFELKEQADTQYAIEIERLNQFSKKWNKFFDDLKAQKPKSQKAKKALKLKETLDKAQSQKNKKQVVVDMDALLNDETKFDPKSKIKDYIVATESEGFNMDDVLNPGALKLEDLCKEMGLMEENE